MSRVSKTKAMLMSCLALFTIVTGCSDGSSGGNNGKQAGQEKVAETISNEPVNLSIYHNGGDLSDEEFQIYIAEPVSKKYPNFKLELVRTGKGTQPQDLLSANNFPDIVYTSNPGIPNLQLLDVPEDMAPYIKKHNFDVNRIQNVAVDLMKIYDKDKFIALPVTMNVGALIYNKDIFDKFAVEYPKDHMTWEDVVQLSRKLTRTEGGISYIGLDPWRVEIVGSQMGLSFIDAKTNQVTINTDGWKRVLSLFKEVIDTPGYVNGDKFEYDFFKDNLAMAPIWATQLVSAMNKDKAVFENKNFDLSSLPTFKGYEGKGRGIDAHVMLISKTSKHKDEAFKVITEVLSNEVQMKMSGFGRVSPLKDEAMKANFHNSYPMMKNKNVQAFFKTAPTPLPPPSRFENEVRLFVRDTKRKLALEKKDVNTVLRETQEQAEKKMAELLAK